MEKNSIIWLRMGGGKKGVVLEGNWNPQETGLKWADKMGFDPRSICSVDPHGTSKKIKITIDHLRYSVISVIKLPVAGHIFTKSTRT